MNLILITLLSLTLKVYADDFATMPFKDLTAQAETGNPSAQYALGWRFEDGEGVKRNLKQAFEWYRKAGEKGDLDAQVRLGEFYASGLGTSQDFKESVVWYRKAAEKGSAIAQYNLAISYAWGKGE